MGFVTYLGLIHKLLNVHVWEAEERTFHLAAARGVAVLFFFVATQFFF